MQGKTTHLHWRRLVVSKAGHPYIPKPDKRNALKVNEPIAWRQDDFIARSHRSRARVHLRGRQPICIESKMNTEPIRIQEDVVSVSHTCCHDIFALKERHPRSQFVLEKALITHPCWRPDSPHDPLHRRRKATRNPFTWDQKKPRVTRSH